MKTSTPRPTSPAKSKPARRSPPPAVAEAALFDYRREDFANLAEDVLRRAKALGASDAVVDVSESNGLAVNVRKGKVETIEQTRDKGLSVTVYLGTRRGHASTSDFSTDALDRAVRAAHDIARVTGEDPFAGLPDVDRLALQHESPRLLFPWQISADEAVELARGMEAAAFAVSPQIANSDGASVSTSHGHFLSANSLGFVGGFPYSGHSIACSPIARDGRLMQRDSWYSSRRAPEDLADPEQVGVYAARRALARLGARKISSRRVPVLFEAQLACGLLGSFVQAVSGAALYRKATFLVDSLGRKVFPDHIDIREDPTVPKGMGTSPFDDEGVATSARDVVRNGVVEGYFLSSYSARKLGMQTTGNAGGSHNLTLKSSKTRKTHDFERMLKQLGTGLLVTEMLGQGVNYVTGDYSRGASGYWVENGEIVHPVEEITIASTLGDMFAGVVGIGSDVTTRGNKQTGSILIESMAVGG